MVVTAYHDLGQLLHASSQRPIVSCAHLDFLLHYDHRKNRWMDRCHAYKISAILQIVHVALKW